MVREVFRGSVILSVSAGRRWMIPAKPTLAAFGVEDGAPNVGGSGLVRDGFFEKGFLPTFGFDCLLCVGHGLYFHDDLEDVAGEGVVSFLVVGGYGRSVVDANACSLVRREDEWLGALNTTTRNLCSIDRKGG